MINWFDMPAEGLSNGGLFEVKELEVTENGTYETKGEMYNKVTVNVEGGGSSWQTVFEGSVTTVADDEEYPSAVIPELANLSADTIRVTFNGVEYTCEKIEEDEGVFVYGDDTFTEYPFFISINPRLSTFNTQTAGTYTLKIEEEQSGGGSSDFSTAEVKAIQNVLGGVEFRTIAIIFDGEMEAGSDDADEFFMRSFDWVSVDDPLNVVMYNGHADLILARNGEMQIVATENPDNVVITYDEDAGIFNLALTGDCTITIS